MFPDDHPAHGVHNRRQLCRVRGDLRRDRRTPASLQLSQHPVRRRKLRERNPDLPSDVRWRWSLRDTDAGQPDLQPVHLRGYHDVRDRLFDWPGHLWGKFVCAP